MRRPTAASGGPADSRSRPSFRCETPKLRQRYDKPGIGTSGSPIALRTGRQDADDDTDRLPAPGRIPPHLQKQTAGRLACEKPQQIRRMLLENRLPTPGRPLPAADRPKPPGRSRRYEKTPNARGIRRSIRRKTRSRAIRRQPRLRREPRRQRPRPPWRQPPQRPSSRPGRRHAPP